MILTTPVTKEGLHHCIVNSIQSGSFEGIDECFGDDHGHFWVTNELREHCTLVDFCPFCGRNAPEPSASVKQKLDTGAIVQHPDDPTWYCYKEDVICLYPAFPKRKKA